MNIHLEKFIIFNHGKVFFSTPGNNYYHPYVWFGLPCTKNNQKYIYISVKNIWPCWMLKLLNRMQYFVHRRDKKRFSFLNLFKNIFLLNKCFNYFPLFFFYLFIKSKALFKCKVFVLCLNKPGKKIQKIWNSMQFKTVFYFNFYLLVNVHCK